VIPDPTSCAAEQPNSAAAAALSDKKLRQTNVAAADGCSDWFGAATENPRAARLGQENSLCHLADLQRNRD
jgi:hypothetical protein